MKFAFIAALLALTGCATTQPQLIGLEIDPRDHAECAETRDCTVWSGRQLQGLAERFFNQGRQAGAKGSL